MEHMPSIFMDFVSGCKSDLYESGRQMLFYVDYDYYVGLEICSSRCLKTFDLFSIYFVKMEKIFWYYLNEGGRKIRGKYQNPSS